MTSLASKSAGELKALLARGETCCRDIMSSVLDVVGQREPEIRAYITVRPPEELLAAADAVDRRRAAGEQIGALGGLPVAVKDNLCTKGRLTTCASRMLGNYQPPYDATVVRLVEEADGIIIGKTNMDEFAMGSSTENSAMQVTRNPWNTDYVPGGTSGGSAAAVAAHETILGIGTDTGGSIRQPASYCGVVGFKPTYGRVSRYGLIAYGSSLDQVGPITKTVSDAALLLSVIARHDPGDSTSLNVEPGMYDNLDSFPAGLRIGVPQEFFGPGLDGEVDKSVRDAIAALEAEGAVTVPVSLPNTEYAIPVYYIIVCAEMSSNLARYDGCTFGYASPDATNVIDLMCRTRTEAFGPEVKRRLLLGTYVLSAGYYDAYYLKAARARTMIRGDYEKAFSQCDVIMHPVAPAPAFRVGEKTTDPLEMYLVDIYSVIANLTGMPAISVPCGRSSSGLPIGVQIAGPALSEALLLRVAHRLENRIGTLLQCSR
jgi:aspartyl-tRNA(Asn)/glutamyl-tRNA(Gln) amidotransferase subunit A